MTSQIWQLGGDIAVNRLGFGAMRITGAGVWGPPPDRREAILTLQRAIDLGVTFLDTAESYGPYVSEELIAESLHPYLENLVIATKGGFDRPGPDRWEVNGRPERLWSALEGSLRRLRRERIDLYQLHRVDPAVPADDQFGTLQEMRSRGLIRHVGLSEVDVATIEHARRFVPVASVQNRYNLGDRHWDDVLAFCEREGIAFIPWAPLDAGSLTHRGVGAHLRRLFGRPSSNPAVMRIAARHRATPSQIAIAWLLQRSPVMLPIPGTSSRTHLGENMAAASLTLSADDLAAL